MVAPPGLAPTAVPPLTAAQVMAISSTAALLQGGGPKCYDRQLSRDSSSGPPLPPLWEEGSLAAATALFGGAAGPYGSATLGLPNPSQALGQTLDVAGAAGWGTAPSRPLQPVNTARFQRDVSPDVPEHQKSSSDSEVGGRARREGGERAFDQTSFLNPESPRDPLPSIPMWEFDTVGRSGLQANPLSVMATADVAGGITQGSSPTVRASSVPRGMSPDGPALSWNGAQHMAGGTCGAPGTIGQKSR